MAAAASFVASSPVFLLCPRNASASPAAGGAEDDEEGEDATDFLFLAAESGEGDCDDAGTSRFMGCPMKSTLLTESWSR